MLIFDDVYILKKDAYPWRPLIRVGRVEAWDKVEETAVSDLLFSSCTWESGERRRAGHSQHPKHISIMDGDSPPMLSQGP